MVFYVAAMRGNSARTLWLLLPLVAADGGLDIELDVIGDLDKDSDDSVWSFADFNKRLDSAKKCIFPVLIASFFSEAPPNMDAKVFAKPPETGVVEFKKLTPRADGRLSLFDRTHFSYKFPSILGDAAGLMSYKLCSDYFDVSGDLILAFLRCLKSQNLQFDEDHSLLRRFGSAHAMLRLSVTLLDSDGKEVAAKGCNWRELFDGDDPDSEHGDRDPVIDDGDGHAGARGHDGGESDRGRAPRPLVPGRSEAQKQAKKDVLSNLVPACPPNATQCGVVKPPPDCTRQDVEERPWICRCVSGFSGILENFERSDLVLGAVYEGICVRTTTTTYTTTSTTTTTITHSPTVAPTSAPTLGPTPEGTPEPTVEPTPSPTLATEQPTPAPTNATGEPTCEPTPEPTPEPTAEPTPKPTEEPTPEPTPKPTPKPTPEPTEEPTPPPTQEELPAPPTEKEEEDPEVVREWQRKVKRWLSNYMTKICTDDYLKNKEAWTKTTESRTTKIDECCLFSAKPTLVERFTKLYPDRVQEVEDMNILVTDVKGCITAMKAFVPHVATVAK